MDSSRLYTATFENITDSGTLDTLIELGSGATPRTVRTIHRIWLSPVIENINEVVEIRLYRNDLNITGGTVLTNQPLTPTAAANPSGATVRAVSVAGPATPDYLDNHAFHVKTGWLLTEIPFEMVSSSPFARFGVEQRSGSQAFTWSGGVTWSEIQLS